MSITGSWNKHFNGHNTVHYTGGFTLIELTMVILLFGLLVSFTIPRLESSILTDDLKKASRKIVGTINELRNTALRNHRDYYLKLDLESGRLWIDSPSMSEEERTIAREQSSPLPETVHFIDIWFKEGGKKSMGEASIRFTRKGYIQPSAIHLGSDDGRIFTLLMQPFLGKVELTDSYMEFEDA